MDLRALILGAAVVGALLAAGCGDSGSGETGDETSETGDTSDETSETGDETSETDDTPETGETGDETSDTGDETGDPGDTGEADASIGEADAAADGASGVTDADDADDATADADVGPTLGDVADTSDVEDAGPDASEPPWDPNVLDPEPFPASVLECDAGDLAWVSRTLQALYGRKAYGVAELQVWAALVAQSDRETVLDVLMATDDFYDRWQVFLMDALRINRVGDKKHDVCYGTPIQDPKGGEIAEFVRKYHATKSGGVGQFNMTDLLASALRLDDMSVVYRAHLFAMLEEPITGANVAALEMEITRRQDFGEVFEASYVYRKKTCMTCHNSTYSVTGDDDPALDRTWEIPGQFEVALYEEPGGRAEPETRAMLRHMGVVTSGLSGKKPWGWAESCGRFVSSADVEDDPVGTDAFFIEPYGLTGSVWQLEEALRGGFEGLREDGLGVDPETLEVDGEEAFAYLVSVNFVNQLWAELMGYPLTIANYFPRNRPQRDALWEMTEQFIADGFSLRAALRYVLLDPRYNQHAPSAGCGDLEGYYMRPAFDPWSVHEEEAIQGNGVGDLLVRHSARNLLNMLSTALLWPAAPAYPDGADEKLHVAIGVFTKDAEPGFRGTDLQGLLAWEDAFGVCEPEADPDWIHALVSVATAEGAAATVGDAVASLKDRLIQEPAIAADEAALIEALIATPLTGLAAEAPELEQGLRRFCGVLLESPQFMLAGAPGVVPAEAAAPLIVEGGGFDALCATIASSWDAAAWTVACADGDLTLTPAAPENDAP